MEEVDLPPGYANRDTPVSLAYDPNQEWLFLAGGFEEDFFDEVWALTLDDEWILVQDHLRSVYCGDAEIASSGVCDIVYGVRVAVMCRYLNSMNLLIDAIYC